MQIVVESDGSFKYCYAYCSIATSLLYACILIHDNSYIIYLLAIISVFMQVMQHINVIISK